MVEMLVDLTDAELVRRCQDNDDSAVHELYRRYREKVYRIACRVVLNHDDALDVTQDVFVRVLKGIGAFRFQSSFSTWITRVTVNVAIDSLRKRRRMKSVAFEATEPEETDAAVFKRDQVDKVRAAFELLDPVQRSCIVLREIEGASYAEIAQALSCSIGTVRSRIHRARGHLKRILKDMVVE